MFFNDIPKKIKGVSGEFVNGFMLVQMNTGKFGYIRKSDGQLLPYRFAIASNFNELGFAVVGTLSGVTWINKNFCYLSQECLTYQCSKKTNPLVNVWESLTSF